MNSNIGDLEKFDVNQVERDCFIIGRIKSSKLTAVQDNQNNNTTDENDEEDLPRMVSRAFKRKRRKVVESSDEDDDVKEHLFGGPSEGNNCDSKTVTFRSAIPPIHIPSQKLKDMIGSISDASTSSDEEVYNSQLILRRFMKVTQSITELTSDSTLDPPDCDEQTMTTSETIVSINSDQPLWPIEPSSVTTHQTSSDSLSGHQVTMSKLSRQSSVDSEVSRDVALPQQQAKRRRAPLQTTKGIRTKFVSIGEAQMERCKKRSQVAHVVRERNNEKIDTTVLPLTSRLSLSNLSQHTKQTADTPLVSASTSLGATLAVKAAASLSLLSDELKAIPQVVGYFENKNPEVKIGKRPKFPAAVASPPPLSRQISTGSAHSAVQVSDSLSSVTSPSDTQRLSIETSFDPPPPLTRQTSEGSSSCPPSTAHRPYCAMPARDSNQASQTSGDKSSPRPTSSSPRANNVTKSTLLRNSEKPISTGTINSNKPFSFSDLVSANASPIKPVAVVTAFQQPLRLQMPFSTDVNGVTSNNSPVVARQPLDSDLVALSVSVDSTPQPLFDKGLGTVKRNRPANREEKAKSVQTFTAFYSAEETDRPTSSGNEEKKSKKRITFDEAVTSDSITARDHLVSIPLESQSVLLDDHCENEDVVEMELSADPTNGLISALQSEALRVAVAKINQQLLDPVSTLQPFGEKDVPSQDGDTGDTVHNQQSVETTTASTTPKSVQLENNTKSSEENIAVTDILCSYCRSLSKQLVCYNNQHINGCAISVPTHLVRDSDRRTDGLRFDAIRPRKSRSESETFIRGRPTLTPLRTQERHLRRDSPPSCHGRESERRGRSRSRSRSPIISHRNRRSTSSSVEHRKTDARSTSPPRREIKERCLNDQQTCKSPRSLVDRDTNPSSSSRHLLHDREDRSRSPSSPLHRSTHRDERVYILCRCCRSLAQYDSCETRAHRDGCSVQISADRLTSFDIVVDQHTNEIQTVPHSSRATCTYIMCKTCRGLSKLDICTFRAHHNGFGFYTPSGEVHTRDIVIDAHTFKQIMISKHNVIRDGAESNRDSSTKYEPFVRHDNDHSKLSDNTQPEHLRQRTDHPRSQPNLPVMEHPTAEQSDLTCALNVSPFEPKASCDDLCQLTVQQSPSLVSISTEDKVHHTTKRIHSEGVNDVSSAISCGSDKGSNGGDICKMDVVVVTKRPRLDISKIRPIDFTTATTNAIKTTVKPIEPVVEPVAEPVAVVEESLFMRKLRLVREKKALEGKGV